MSDIIAACSTPPGKGAIAVIRLSGKGCVELASRLFSPMPDAPGKTRVGYFSAEFFKDRSVCVYYTAPRSYTGEDMAEFYVHGGIAVVEGVLRACFREGASPAERGEFSRRAFVNGKLSLEGAEGAIEMIDAECAAGVRYGSDMLSSRLTNEVREYEKRLLHIASSVEAVLDYPEEDLEEELKEVNKETFSDIIAALDKTIENSRNAPVLKHGADVAIIGQVNAGKSSLLNALTMSDRAIVSSRAGTTRDVLTADLVVEDMLFHLYDTAGLRETDDEIEAEGVKRSKRAANECDAVLFVSENPVTEKEKDFLLGLNKPYAVVYSKRDLRNEDIDGGMNVSVKWDVSAIKKTLLSFFPRVSGTVVINARMLRALTDAKEALEAALHSLSCETMDITAFHIGRALESFGGITGENASDKVTEEIFSRFCLGK